MKSMVERLEELENKIDPLKIDVVIWEKYKGITKDEAIQNYKDANNLTELDNYILVVVPTNDEIREELRYATEGTEQKIN